MIPSFSPVIAEDGLPASTPPDQARIRDLTFQVLVQLIETTDRQSLAQLGLEPELITTLEGLTLEQLRHLARFGSHFLHLHLDPHCLTYALQRMLDRQRADQLQERLLRHQAPAAMMQALFGMGKREFIRQRRPLGLPPGCRPRSPGPEELALLGRSWQETAGEPLARRYLHLAERTGLSLANIWAARADFQAPTRPVGKRAGDQT